jgi:hypothetical protein
MRAAHLIWCAALALLSAGCSDGSRYRQAIAVLVDVSGTYTDQQADVSRVIKREILPALVPGDTLLLIRIDSQSYEKENVETLMTLDARPSHANAQKLAFAEKLDAFAAGAAPAEYTDIRGAMMLAAEYLRETAAGSRVIMVFSDMQEDLPQGTSRALGPDELAGIEVVAVNVKRLNVDNADPQRYRGRLANWESGVLSHGATGWRAIFDTGQVAGYLSQLR